MTKKKKLQLFSPDAISTSIHQALRRDLARAKKLESLVPEARDVLIDAQVRTFLKKYDPEVSRSEDLEQKAFNTFLSVNEHMSEFSFSVPDRLAKDSTDLERVLIRARTLCQVVLGRLTIDEWFTHCKNSKGSSIGVPYVDTSPERKMKYPLSVTSRAKPLFAQYLHWDTQYSDAIEKLNEHNICSRYEVVEGSRATTVPKSDSARRMIAIEPTCNMFLQQGLMAVLYERLNAAGLDVSVLPSEHTRKAFEGSVGRHLATIDFSSASDCMHTELLRIILPPSWFRALYNVRCDSMEINSSRVELNMFSTMGNACTFPLETLLFWVLACAANTLEDKRYSTIIPSYKRTSISVFGDDCIVPTSLAQPFMAIAEQVGFIVNHDKSFWTATEAFRESCGGDYHAGCDVRPFYLKAPTSNRISALGPWLHVILNGLIKLYRKLFGSLTYLYDQEVFRCIVGMFHEYKIKFHLVPEWFPDDAGYNQGDEYRFCSVYGIEIQPIKRDRHGTYRFRFYRFTYPEQSSTYSYLRYALELKQQLIRGSSTDRSPRFSPRRMRGGYVVGKGLSSHWELLWKAAL